MTKKQQEMLFGSEFERLDHRRRVDILFVLGTIRAEQKANFDHVRDRRRKYLHLYSHDDISVQSDARTVFLATVELVVDIVGQDMRDGVVMLRPELVAYLRDRGLARVPTDAVGMDETP